MHAVANENAYTHVFNYDAGMGTAPILLHYPTEAAISDLVLKKMGITPKPVSATPTAAAQRLLSLLLPLLLQSQRLPRNKF